MLTSYVKDYKNTFYLSISLSAGETRNLNLTNQSILYGDNYLPISLYKLLLRASLDGTAIETNAKTLVEVIVVIDPTDLTEPYGNNYQKYGLVYMEKKAIEIPVSALSLYNPTTSIVRVDLIMKQIYSDRVWNQIKGIEDDLVYENVPLVTVSSGDEIIYRYEAQEDLDAYKVVCFGQANKIKLADSTDTSIYGKIIGVTSESALTGNLCTIKVNGQKLTNPAWHFGGPNAGRVYLGTDSEVSVISAGNIVQQVGIFLDNTTILVEIGLPVIMN